MCTVYLVHVVIAGRSIHKHRIFFLNVAFKVSTIYVLHTAMLLLRCSSCALKQLVFLLLPPQAVFRSKHHISHIQDLYILSPVSKFIFITVDTNFYEIDLIV